MLIDATDYAIYMQQVHTPSWNSGAKRFKGYDESEILGENFAASTPQRTVRPGSADRPRNR